MKIFINNKNPGSATIPHMTRCCYLSQLTANTNFKAINISSILIRLLSSTVEFSASNRFQEKLQLFHNKMPITIRKVEKEEDFEKVYLMSKVSKQR